MDALISSQNTKCSPVQTLQLHTPNPAGKPSSSHDEIVGNGSIRSDPEGSEEKVETDCIV